MRHGCLYLQTSFEEPVALALCIDNQLSEREAHANQAIEAPSGGERDAFSRSGVSVLCSPWEFHCRLPACQKALAGSSFRGTGGQLRLV